MAQKTATKVLAFHNDSAIKQKYVDRVEAHAKADEIIQDKYWSNGKGCAVGCTVEQFDSPHEAMEDEIGVPRELAFLEDTIFERLTNGEAKEFPLRFLQAIKPGADLSSITARFMIWQFEDEQYGLKNIKEVKEDAEIYGFCEEVAALYRRVEVGADPTEDEFYALYDRIDQAGAWTGAWARTRTGAGPWAWTRPGAWAWTGAGAWTGARTGAWAWARAWARAWTRPGAWAWTGAGARTGAWAWARTRTGAESLYWTAAAEKLISLLVEASNYNELGTLGPLTDKQRLIHESDDTNNLVDNS